MLNRKRLQNQTEQALRQLHEKLELGRRARMFAELFQPGAPFPKTPEALEARYQKRFSRPRCQVLFLRTNRDLQQESNFLLAQKLQEVVLRVFPRDKGFSPCVELVRRGMGVVLNFEEENREGVRNRLPALLYDLREAARGFGCGWVSVGLGTEAPSLAGLREAARSAWEAERARLILGANRVWAAGETAFAHRQESMVLTTQKQKEFRQVLEALEGTELKAWLERLREPLERKPPLSPEAFCGVLDWVTETAARYARTCRAEEAARQLEEERRRIEEEEEGLSGIWTAMTEALLRFQQQLREEKSSRESIAIRLAKSYLAEHYGEPVTLEMTAAAVGLSPAYFSTNFKKIQGQTFTDYLTEVRLQAARELLATTQKTNYEIACQVGYADDKYFCKVFKREVGIRPGEYRKLYYRGGEGLGEKKG